MGNNKKKCPECNGKGFVFLLTSKVKCSKCNKKNFEQTEFDFDKNTCSAFSAGITEVTSTNNTFSVEQHKGYKLFIDSINDFFEIISENNNGAGI